MEPSPGDIAAMASLIIGRKKTLHDEREAALQARVREMDERDNDS
jgi:hypothetical protein